MLVTWSTCGGPLILLVSAYVSPVPSGPRPFNSSHGDSRTQLLLSCLTAVKITGQMDHTCPYNTDIISSILTGIFNEHFFDLELLLYIFVI
jgi:hypothetical protein